MLMIGPDFSPIGLEVESLGTAAKASNDAEFNYFVFDAILWS